jgi:U3 small nucleolar RNA-associated protein 14
MKVIVLTGFEDPKRQSAVLPGWGIWVRVKARGSGTAVDCHHEEAVTAYRDSGGHRYNM